MSTVRVAVVYYSTYGTSHQLAELAAQAARDAGAEVRLRKVRETAPPEVVAAQQAWNAHAEKTADIAIATPDDMVWANAYIFSAPTRYGGAASQMRSFIDTLGPIWQEGKLANKAFTAMSSAMNPHGGQEATVLTLYITTMHWGCVLVPPGYTDSTIYPAGGNPYGTTITANGQPISDDAKASIQFLARRLVEISGKLAQ